MSHGLRVTYIRGCRCKPCTTANREYKRALRRRMGKPPVARPVERFPVQDCAICRAPLAVHHPYFQHLQVGP